MVDLLFVGVTVAVFALAVWFVHACDRLIGPDATPVEVPPAAAPGARTEAGAR